MVGATVVLNGTSEIKETDNNGVFSFPNVPAGTYSITMVSGANPPVTVPVGRVSAGVMTTLEPTEVDWEVGGVNEIVNVEAPSRQRESTVDAPAAVTVVTEAEIEREASHGQLPKLVEHTPGAQMTQGDVGDFNFGTRGYNSALSKRVAVLLDGRDMALPLTGFQYWAAISFPLDDLSTVEFVRGPSAALYGANASGGVINLTTKEPRYSPGGMVRVAFGELDTLNLDARWAGELGNGWYARVVGGGRDSGLFAVSRVDGPEYSVACVGQEFMDCLAPETVPLEGHFQAVYGGLRLDKYLSNGVLLTMEGGHAMKRGASSRSSVSAARAPAAGGRGCEPTSTRTTTTSPLPTTPGTRRRDTGA